MATPISDEQMRAMLPTARVYTLALLHPGPRYRDESSRPIIWEHARRNFALRADGVLPIVGPVIDDSDLCGMGIFTGDVAETTAIMDADPGVEAGVFTYELHPVRGFPGATLP